MQEKDIQILKEIKKQIENQLKKEDYILDVHEVINALLQWETSKIAYDLNKAEDDPELFYKVQCKLMEEYPGSYDYYLIRDLLNDMRIEIDLTKQENKEVYERMMEQCMMRSQK